jgi:transposase
MKTGIDWQQRTTINGEGGVPRVDDRRVVSGIVYVIRHGLQWKDAPKGYGPHKTLYNRFIRWSRLGVFDRIFASLAAEGPKPERIMIDSTHLKTHRKRLFDHLCGEA